MKARSKDVWSIFAETADKFPEKEAVVIQTAGRVREAITYGDLKLASSNIAANLYGEGLRHGERVVIFSPNNFGWLEVALALAKLGAVNVPIDTKQSKEGVAHILAETEPRFIFADLTLIERIPNEWQDKIILLDQHNHYRHLDEFLVEPQFSLMPEKVRGEDILMIVYTSGTTGDPKGVVIPHSAFLEITCPAAISRLKLKKKDIIVTVGPWFHVMGALSLLTVFSLGATLVYTTNFKEILEIMGREKATILLAPPLLFDFLLRGIAEKIEEKGRLYSWLYGRVPWLFGWLLAAKYGLGNLRFMVSGSAKLSPETWHGFKRLGRRFEIQEGLGMAENASLSHIAPLGKAKPGSVGILIPAMEEEIRRVRFGEEGLEILKEKAGVGEWGVLFLRGPNVLPLGYWNRPDLTSQFLDSDRWFNTYDWARLDEDGFLEIEGRIGDVRVLSNGKNVSLARIERVMGKSPHLDWVVAEVFNDRVCLMLFPTKKVAKAFSGNKERLIDALWPEIQLANQKLADYERVAKRNIFIGEGSPPLTSTLKVQRHKVIWPRSQKKEE